MLHSGGATTWSRSDPATPATGIPMSTGGGYLTKDDIKELSGIDVVEVSGRCGAGPHRRHEPARGAAAAGKQPHAQQGDRLLLECVQEEHAGAHLREAHAGGGQGRGVEAEEGPVRAKRIVCLFATNRPLFGSPGYGDRPPFSVRPSFENHMGTTVPNLGWTPPQIWGRRRPEKYGIPHKQQKTTHSLS